MVKFLSSDGNHVSSAFNSSYLKAREVLGASYLASQIALFWRDDKFSLGEKIVLYDPVWWLQHDVNYSKHAV